MIKAEVRCGAGMFRSANQDNYYVNGEIRSDIQDRSLVALHLQDCRDGIFAVCDGMGGEAFGEAASFLAVQMLQNAESRNGGVPMDRTVVQNLILEMNTAVCALSEEKEARTGTTIASVVMSGESYFAVNVGDSGVFVFSGKKLRKLSHDHTQIQQMMELGYLSEEEARVHPRRHVLSQYLGVFPEETVLEPYVSDDQELHSGEILLLCSDGLTDMVQKSEIEKGMNLGVSICEKADYLYNLAIAKGGKDNITLILIELEEEV